jgi:phosphoribosyl 1,2-cyclic phosphodiesterase
MRIKVWGCRGSIPSPGGDTSKYGGNTTCIEVRLGDGSLVVIDAGSGIRNLGRELVRRREPRLIHLFLTHAHWDHLQGFPFFLPAYQKGFTLQVWGGPRSAATLRSYLRQQLTPPFFPVKFAELGAAIRFPARPATQIRIGGTSIQSIPLTHPDGGYGFKFSEEGRTFVFLTDNELGFSHPGGLREEDYIDAARGADLLLHDAQYSDEEYASRTRGWGHSTYTQAARFAARAGAKRLGTFHHDPDHDDRTIDASVRLCRKVLRQAGSRAQCFGAAEGTELLV